MAKTFSQEERQFLKFIETLPLTEEAKVDWTERVQTGQMSNELGEEIRLKLIEPVEGETAQVHHTRALGELAGLMRRWRLASQSRNFGKK